MRLDAHGIEIELPKGWSGRLFSRAHGVATLHAGNFTLALQDGEFGDRSTGAMGDGAMFIALTEYRPGAGLVPGTGLFASKRLPRRLDPTSLKTTGLAHPRPGQAGTQHFFTASGRPFCLYIVVAGGRSIRRRQLAHIDHVLATLRIHPSTGPYERL
jgi:hypothetical protein